MSTYIYTYVYILMAEKGVKEWGNVALRDIPLTTLAYMKCLIIP